jgi:N-acetylglucosaminyldiphosphoundecaprenol N-acetyl-beta-D-mannosaminyltransferase
MTAQEDHAFRQILNEADVTTPDGMPLVWALRSFGMRSQQRVYGPTLMLRVCEQAAQAGHRIFLYGGRPETLPLLCEKLTDRFPELQIVGQYSPPFRSLTEHEEVSVRDAVERADPDIIFVGISTPKQENWMRSHRDAFSGRILIGVGAAFDFHAGRVKQAPSWMQRAGLEWLFRLLSEPARLWRRYLLVTPWFLPHWALQKSGLRKYPLS